MAEGALALFFGAVRDGRCFFPELLNLIKAGVHGSQ